MSLRLSSALLLLAAGPASGQQASSDGFQLQSLHFDAGSQGTCTVSNALFVAADWVGGTGLGSDNFQAEVGFLGVYDPGATTLPIVFSVSPPHGPIEGGTTFSVGGLNFSKGGLAGTVSVDVDGVPATGVSVVSDTTITATSPPGTLGPHPLTVTTDFGSDTAEVGFVYSPAVTAPLTASPGTMIDVVNYGPPGTLFQMYFSAFETSIPLPPFGVLEIGPTPLVAALTGVMYPGPDGVHVIQAQVQPNPTLVGKAVHIQSVAILSFVPFDVRLTNKATVSFL